MLTTRTRCWVLGLLFAEGFVFCVIRDLLTPFSEPVRRAFEVFLPGFRWATPATFLLGIVESFLWGAYLELMTFPMIKMYVLKHHHYSLPQSKTQHSHHHAA
jgi:hypothetical protein